MANSRSAWKRVRMTSRKNLRNRMVRSSYRTALKRFESAVAQNDGQVSLSLYTIAVSSMDKAVAKGVLHKNNANRKKAGLAKKLAAVAAK